MCISIVPFSPVLLYILFGGYLLIRDDINTYNVCIHKLTSNNNNSCESIIDWKGVSANKKGWISIKLTCKSTRSETNNTHPDQRFPYVYETCICVNLMIKCRWMCRLTFYHSHIYCSSHVSVFKGGVFRNLTSFFCNYVLLLAPRSVQFNWNTNAYTYTHTRRERERETITKHWCIQVPLETDSNGILTAWTWWVQKQNKNRLRAFAV